MENWDISILFEGAATPFEKGYITQGYSYIFRKGYLQFIWGSGSPF